MVFGTAEKKKTRKKSNQNVQHINLNFQRLMPQALRLGIGIRRWPLSRWIISIILMPGSHDVSRVAVATILRFGSASYATDSTPNIAHISCAN